MGSSEGHCRPNLRLEISVKMNLGSFLVLTGDPCWQHVAKTRDYCLQSKRRGCVPSLPAAAAGWGQNLGYLDCNRC